MKTFLERLDDADGLWQEVYDSVLTLAQDLDAMRSNDEDCDEVSAVRETAHDIIRLFFAFNATGGMKE